MRLDHPVSNTVLLTFGTPLLRRVWPNSASVNDGICRLALAREREGAGIVLSNVGGWHSHPDFLDAPDPAVQTLRQWIRDAVLEVTQIVYGDKKPNMTVALEGVGWVNVVRRGAFHKMHNHPGATWSGVYYAATGSDDAGAPSESGVIEFLDPRMAPALTPLPGPPTSPTLGIQPLPGLMLVFPGWLYHAVNQYTGDGVRISVAFNANFRPRS